jgi:hypothetical protein
VGCGRFHDGEVRPELVDGQQFVPHFEMHPHLRGDLSGRRLDE